MTMHTCNTASFESLTVRRRRGRAGARPPVERSGEICPAGVGRRGGRIRPQGDEQRVVVDPEACPGSGPVAGRRVGATAAAERHQVAEVREAERLGHGVPTLYMIVESHRAGFFEFFFLANKY